MNYNKAQKDIFNCILQGKKCGFMKIDDNTVMVTGNGVVGYVFSCSMIAFNPDKLNQINNDTIEFNIIDPEYKMNITPDIRIANNNLQLRRLTNYKRNAYVNVKYLECFQNPNFYQKLKYSPVVVTENGIGKKEYIVGVIMPVTSGAFDRHDDYYRMTEYSDSEY